MEQQKTIVTKIFDMQNSSFLNDNKAYQTKPDMYPITSLELFDSAEGDKGTEQRQKLVYLDRSSLLCFFFKFSLSLCICIYMYIKVNNTLQANHLVYLGATSLRSFLRMAVKQTMTDNVATQFSIEGNRGNRRFLGTKHATLIYST